MRRYWCLFFCCLLSLASGAAQDPEDRRNTGQAILLGFSYAYQLPGGDLRGRFGNHFSLGGDLEWMTGERNWQLGLAGQYQFGSTVKEDVLAGLRNLNGGIIAAPRQVADIPLRQRGWLLAATVGKLIGLVPQNPRSGLRVRLGIGYWEHRIRIPDDPAAAAPQLSAAYKQGYDRRTGGPALIQSIGYELLSSNGQVNFFLQLDLLQGFTQNRRPLNYDTGRSDADRRVDLAFGLRLGWVLPFYFGRAADEIFY